MPAVDVDESGADVARGAHRPDIEELRAERFDRVILVGVERLAGAHPPDALGEQTLTARRPVRRGPAPGCRVVDLGVTRGRPLDQQGRGRLAQLLEGGGAVGRKEDRGAAVCGRGEHELGRAALGHRRLDAVLDDARGDAPALVDEAVAHGVAVDRALAAHHPARARERLGDLLVAVLLAHGVAAALGPLAGEALHLFAHRQVLPGVHDRLLLAEEVGLVQAPGRPTAQQDRLADLPRGREEHGDPDEQPVGVVLELAHEGETLPPAQSDARLGLEELERVGPVAADGVGVRGGHVPRPCRRGGHVAQLGQPWHIPERSVRAGRLRGLGSSGTGRRRRCLVPRAVPAEGERLVLLARPARRQGSAAARALDVSVQGERGDVIEFAGRGAAHVTLGPRADQRLTAALVCWSVGRASSGHIEVRLRRRPGIEP